MIFSNFTGPIGPLLLEKKIFKGFLPYKHSSQESGLDYDSCTLPLLTSVNSTELQIRHFLYLCLPRAGMGYIAFQRDVTCVCHVCNQILTNVKFTLKFTLTFTSAFLLELITWVHFTCFML